jgi:NAD(P)H-hydrate epimerase
MLPAAHPILTCAGAHALEKRLFAGDEAKEWQAMQKAGAAVGAAVLQDFREIGGFPAGGRVLVVAGKGHNGGDALIAAAEILRRESPAAADVHFVYGVPSIRPQAMRAWRELQQAFPERVRAVPLTGLAAAYAITLDGLFGYRYQPPLDARARSVLEKVNALGAALRAAIDLPSGWAEEGAFQADFTYATGIVKAPLLDLPNAGRLRYLDLGFFAAAIPKADAVLTSDVLAPLRTWRDPRADKRKLGHLFVLGGSREYPGAVLMTVLAALKAGAGLVSAFVPESLVPAFAARVPEAIWIGWPETPAGGLALEGRHLLLERLARAGAMVMGPGLGNDRESHALLRDLVGTVPHPLLLDADALRPEIVQAARGRLVLTPHAGEFARIAGRSDLRSYARKSGAVVVLKGPVTRIAHGGRILRSFFGGPVLARGGSGDLLAGIMGAQLALTPADLPAAASRGVVWHGRAADALARTRGAVAVRTTDLLDFLNEGLRL